MPHHEPYTPIRLDVKADHALYLDGRVIGKFPTLDLAHDAYREAGRMSHLALGLLAATLAMRPREQA